ncbi:MerC domain-containing protein [Flavobacterium sp. MR2016-29]|nr:MerC domain-containing protein [Flavobacterium sp. MR2016-29]
MKITNYLDKLGLSGVIITALLSPCCFPLFAFGASALGLGSFELFGGWTMWVFFVMIIISIIGLAFSYQKHHSLYPLLLALSGTLLIAYGYYIGRISPYFYIGMFGMLVSTVMNYLNLKTGRSYKICSVYNGKSVELASTITCPQCGYTSEEIMPIDACAFFYECSNCKTRLRPKQGDCCVYCSYGTVKCPPIQIGDNCC